MHKSFSFKGINRSTDLLLASEGECVDVVNLRMSNGCLCPMPQPVPCADLPGVYSAVYTHSTTGFSVAITSDMKKTLDSAYVKIPQKMLENISTFFSTSMI